jgi:hypothetical protein
MLRRLARQITEASLGRRPPLAWSKYQYQPPCGATQAVNGAENKALISAFQVFYYQDTSDQYFHHNYTGYLTYYEYILILCQWLR